MFAGGFDLDAVEAVGGTGGIEVLDVAGLLGSLVDKSLVMAEPAGQTLRYRLLETIRQYAAERLAEAGGQDAAAKGHCAYFLGVAEAAAPHLTGPEQGQWLARLDADYANLRHAAEYAARDPDGTAQGLRFSVALHRYWLARSREREALALLLSALERPGAHADPALFAAALITVTAVSVFVDLAPARQAGQQAVELARELHDDRLLIFALSALSAAYCFLGETDPGLLTGQEAVERARQLGDDVLLGESLMSYLLSGDPIEPDQFGQLLAEATACTERSGDQLIHYALHNNAGVHALTAGDIPAARAHLEQAAHAARDRNGNRRLDRQPRLGAPRGRRPGRRAVRVRNEPADKPPQRRTPRHGLRHPRPGLPGRRPRRLGPGRLAPRHRAGLPRPDRTTVARSRSAVPARQPHPAARPPERRTV